MKSYIWLLQNQGDFLVRETSKKASDAAVNTPLIAVGAKTSTNCVGNIQPFAVFHTNGIPACHANPTVVTKMVLSVYWHGHKHFILQGGPAMNAPGWYLEEGVFPTVRFRDNRLSGSYDPLLLPLRSVPDVRLRCNCSLLWS
ncbi:unnamed protein product [Protopolystoma xenopodis]|uniref:Uncharacterized protein n=1 Tax=Protopolystoma xenopodis TaxID=117903 RepID=A0A3S5CTQ4_9PLAT|nr:unnamed protein product [Protopolystoma xenopodis]